MVLALVLTVLTGIIVGYFLIPVSWITQIDTVSTGLLFILLLGIGIDLGGSDRLFARIKELGYKVLLIPLLIAAGSIVGAMVVGNWLDFPLNEAGAVGAGFGWYSLSGIILGKLHSAKLGALAFLTNITREIMAIIMIPLLAKKRNLSVIAPGGATTMDTTLPLISESVNQPEIVITAFISGSILSALVPVLVPLLIQL